MIEVFNADRTMSLGSFVSFKAAKRTLGVLAISGMLGKSPAVLVCSYKNDEPVREYTATFVGGKWRVPRKAAVSSRLEADVCPGRQHRKVLHKIYSSPEALFNEAFPDWLNRSYPVPYADNLRNCNRKCRVI